MPYVFNDDKSRVDFSSAFNTCYAAKRELIWTNPDITMGFQDETITFSSPINLNNYENIEIVTWQGLIFRFLCDDNVHADISGTVLKTIYVDYDIQATYLISRDVSIQVSNNQIAFGHACIKLLSAQDVTIFDDYLKPWKIYGIKA